MSPYLSNSSCRKRLCFSFCIFLETWNTSLRFQGKGGYLKATKVCKFRPWKALNTWSKYKPPGSMAGHKINTVDHCRSNWYLSVNAYYHPIHSWPTCPSAPVLAGLLSAIVAAGVGLPPVPICFFLAGPKDFHSDCTASHFLPASPAAPSSETVLDVLAKVWEIKQIHFENRKEPKSSEAMVWKSLWAAGKIE